MQEQTQDLFQSTVEMQNLLAKAEVASAVIGGLALAVWGEPRLTRDVDLKVLLGRDQADLLVSLLLRKHYTCLAKDPRQTLERMGFLFVKDRTGIRLDLLLAETDFDTVAMSRIRTIEVTPGLVLRLCSPEDLIVYKLISTRARDCEDAQTVILRQGDTLDDNYIRHWLKEFERALDDSTLIATYTKWRHQGV